jgi:hypothetical protein
MCQYFNFDWSMQFQPFVGVGGDDARRELSGMARPAPAFPRFIVAWWWWILH